VLGDVAVVEPTAGVVGEEVGDLHGGGEELDDIGAAAAFFDDAQAVPVGGVKIFFGAEAEKIPAGALAGVHFEAGEVAENVAVDGEAGGFVGALLGLGPLERGGLAAGAGVGAVVGDEGAGAGVVGGVAGGGGVDEEFAAGAVGRAVGPGPLSSKIMKRVANSRSMSAGVPSGRARRGIGDDEGADEAEVGLGVAIDVAVVEPGFGTGLGGERAGEFVELPDVGEGGAGADGGAATGGGAVVGALVVFVVAHAVRVHGDGLRGAVQERDDEVVADDAAEDGAEEAEGRVGEGADGEGGVGVLDVAEFGAGALGDDGGREVEAADEVAAGGGEIPRDELGGDVVAAGFERIGRGAEEVPPVSPVCTVTVGRMGGRGSSPLAGRRVGRSRSRPRAHAQATVIGRRKRARVAGMGETVKRTGARCNRGT
jgi:hypothetical protein